MSPPYLFASHILGTGSNSTKSDLRNTLMDNASSKLCSTFINWKLYKIVPEKQFLGEKTPITGLVIGLKLNILEREKIFIFDGSCVQLSFSVTSIQQNTNKQYVEITFRPLFGNHTLFVRTTFFHWREWGTGWKNIHSCQQGLTSSLVVANREFYPWTRVEFYPGVFTRHG